MCGILYAACDTTSQIICFLKGSCFIALNSWSTGDSEVYIFMHFWMYLDQQGLTYTFYLQETLEFWAKFDLNSQEILTLPSRWEARSVIQVSSTFMESFWDSVSAGKLKKDAQISVTDILASSLLWAQTPACVTLLLYTDFCAKPMIYKLFNKSPKIITNQ